MKKYLLTCLFALALFADDITPFKSGVFFGLGGSYNSVRLDQRLNATEFSSIFAGSSLAALGETGGDANPSHMTQSTLAPFAQLGYLYRFPSNRWLLGCKAAYQYLSLTFTENNLDSFKTGSYFVTNHVDLWTGHFFINSSQTSIDHELFFLPLAGYCLGHSSVYLGAGPVVFGTSSHLYGITNFAQLNGTSSDTTGDPTNFSFSKWMWGGVAQLGWIYPFTSCWFLDLSYNYAITGNSSVHDSVPFSNSVITGAVYAQEGVAFIKWGQKICVQSLTIAISGVF